MDLYSKLELLRRKKQRRLFTLVGGIILFFVLIFMTLAVAGDANTSKSAYNTLSMLPFFFILIFVLLIVSSINVTKSNNELQRVYKEEFVFGILKEHFPDATVNWDYGFQERIVESMGMVQMGNRFNSEDYVSGTYEGVHFEQSDVIVKRVVRSGKSTHTYIHFKGRMFSFDYDVKIAASTLVFARSFQYQGGGLGVKYEKVQMESEDFNRKFKVKSVKPFDAFYILTPQMMEYIDKLADIFGNVAIHFTPKKVFVAINMQENAFDLNTSQEISLNRERELRKRDIHVITDIIDILRLSENS